MRSVAQRVRKRVLRQAAPLLLPVSHSTSMTRLGSEYGGWWIPNQALRRGGVAYCVGVGEDVSFDVALVEAGFRVFSFDPTPASIAFMESAQPEGIQFSPTGLWCESGSIRFYVPRDPANVSHSATNAQGTHEYIEVPVETLEGMVSRLGHDSIDLLKMDIEGAELPVLRHMLDTEIRPAVLCVEFDEPLPEKRFLRMVKNLVESGYELAHIDLWNYTFVWRGHPAAQTTV